MTPSETREILKSVEAALQVYWKNEGKLTAQEIRLKSLLSVARAELVQEVRSEHIGRSTGSRDQN